jgi:putative transposase
VSELAADGIPVAVTCRVLKLARQPYYRWRAHPVTDAEITKAYRVNALFDAHRDDPEFGYRYLVEEARTAGESMAERTAWRICSQHRLWSVFGKKRGKNGKTGPPVHDDLVERDFTADAPNQLWLSDITEHSTREGKLYLCAIKDTFSNRIVGYCIDSRMKSRLATTALSNAIARRGEVAGCIVHTDRGSQAGFKWSSQHLDLSEVCGGVWEAAVGGSRLSGADALPGAAVSGLAPGQGPVLGSDRCGGDDRGRRGRSGRVVAGRVPLVPPCWRRESTFARDGFGTLSVLT